MLNCYNQLIMKISDSGMRDAVNYQPGFWVRLWFFTLSSLGIG